MLTRRARLAEISCVAGGAALLASTFLDWVRRGTGSTLRGHDLVDTLMTVGRVPGLDGARLTVLWYLVPACGALTWIVVGRFGADGRGARAVAGLTVIVVGATVAAFAHVVGLANLGIGAAAAVVGALAIAAGVIASARMTATPDRQRAGSSVVRAGDS